MANGTIAFDTLSTSGQISGTAVSVDADYLAYGSAKVWANYLTNDGTSITDSFNVGSLTDSAVGRTYINFSNNMANTNAAGSGNVGDRKVNNSVFIDTTARAFNITFHTIDNGDVDRANVSALIHGDLA